MALQNGRLFHVQHQGDDVCCENGSSHSSVKYPLNNSTRTKSFKLPSENCFSIMDHSLCVSEMDVGMLTKMSFSNGFHIN